MIQDNDLPFFCKVAAQFAQTHSGKLPLEVAMEKAELRGRYGGQVGNSIDFFGLASGP